MLREGNVASADSWQQLLAEINHLAFGCLYLGFPICFVAMFSILCLLH